MAIIGYPTDLPAPALEHKGPISSRAEETVFETGRVRKRRMTSLPLEWVGARWTLTGDQFDTFEKWVRVNLKGGTETFQLQLSGGDIATKNLAFYPPGVYQYEGQGNDLVSVSATLEIM